MFKLEAFEPIRSTKRSLGVERAFGRQSPQASLERLVQFDMFEKGFDPNSLDDIKAYWDILLDVDLFGEELDSDMPHFAEFERKLYSQATASSVQLVS